jgi:transcriptional regulator with XRE-family HTH domain
MDGDKIRIMRVTRRISQQELADMAKVQRSYLSQIESNKRNPSVAILARIAKALDCSINEFF